MSAPVIRALAFDAFGTLFDVHSVGALAEQLFPGKGAALSQLWRLKQIEYTFLRTLSARYAPFDRVTHDALRFAIGALGLPDSDEARERLMAQYGALTPFPENLSALTELKARGFPLAILSNGTPAMLDACVANAGMTGLFDHLLSVNAVGCFKTAAPAYQLAPDAFGLPPGEILFVSSNGWDAAGATWFGFTTFWINRTGQPPEVLDTPPHAIGTRLDEVLAFALSRAPASS